jgi:hypothetical protein
MEEAIFPPTKEFLREKNTGRDTLTGFEGC